MSYRSGHRLDQVWAPENSLCASEQSRIDGEARARPHREELNASAMRLLARLWTKVDLRETAAGFPHLINRFACAWPDLAKVSRTIDELLIDDRPSRQGFPFPVLTELALLKEFCDDWCSRHRAR